MPKSWGVSSRDKVIMIASDSSACPPAVRNAHVNPDSVRRVRLASSGPGRPPGRGASCDSGLTTRRPDRRRHAATRTSPTMKPIPQARWMVTATAGTTQASLRRVRRPIRAAAPSTAAT